MPRKLTVLGIAVALVQNRAYLLTEWIRYHYCKLFFFSTFLTFWTLYQI